MKIRIGPNTTLSEIQGAFQEAFPYLKIEFFTKSHRAFKGSHAKFLIQDMNQKLHDVLLAPKSGELEITPEMLTYQAENLFEEKFGLHVQVLRKSGETWLVTSVTDKLSLAKQNAKGQASEHVHFMPEEPIDYREQE
ncbi:MAG: hypothetical protein H6574_05875 [Lewinellaceae bacterium]|nr:hypothetical protein [Saprospiraceae bacterium]MCB9315882.1 hypothetical protein [Lewinellaceae bacterium]MCB9330589.1 hypothetical protein [Lewinellaceae bacterium]